MAQVSWLEKGSVSNLMQKLHFSSDHYFIGQDPANSVSWKIGISHIYANWQHTKAYLLEAFSTWPDSTSLPTYLKARSHHK